MTRAWWVTRFPVVVLSAALIVATASMARAAESVTYLLPAPIFLPAFGPWMVALERGYYRAAGFNVHFVTAAGGVDVAKQVGIGNAVIGGAIGDTPIIVRSHGIPVKAVAVLGGRGLTQLVFHANSPIAGPADLRGKVVTVSGYQETTYYALLGTLAKVGLSSTDVKIEAAGATNVWKLFLAGKADAFAGVPDWIEDVEHAGGHVRVIPADRFFPSMAQAIVASDTVIREKPKLVQRLVQATLHGMRDIMTDPSGAARDYIKAVPQHTGQEAQITRVFQLYDKYVYPGQKVLGAIDAKRLAALQKFYLKAGIVTKATPVADLYTNGFVR